MSARPSVAPALAVRWPRPSARAERAGLHKIVGNLFADNHASRRLVSRHGFREVGTHLRHGRIDGHWRDVIVVELLLGDARDRDGGGSD